MEQDKENGGINKALGRKASAFTKKMLDKKQIRLEFDRANAHIGHRDKFRKIVARVY